MTVLGIVGAEAAKFTRITERAARLQIRKLFTPDVELVVSGACHLGGIDEWAIDEAVKFHLPFKEHKPAVLEWARGYKPRNTLIAQDSHKVVCLTVRELPASYRGMKFDYCYHCKTGDHVKSGGCWTVKLAKSLGKQGEIIII